MTENLTKVEIKDTYASLILRTPLFDFLICLSVINIILPILMFLIVVLEGINFIVFLIYIIVVLDSILIPFSIYSIKFIRKGKFIVSNDIIEVYIHNRLYLRFYWKDIEKIERIIVKSFFFRGYKLNFIGVKSSKNLSLHYLIFNKKRQTLILNSLKQFSKNHNKKYIEVFKIEKMGSFSKRLKEYDEIVRFKIGKI